MKDTEQLLTVAKCLCLNPSVSLCRARWSSHGRDPAAGDLSEYQGHLEGEVVEQALPSKQLLPQRLFE